MSHKRQTSITTKNILVNIEFIFQIDAGWMGFWLTFGGCASGLILARCCIDCFEFGRSFIELNLDQDQSISKL